MKSVLLIVKRWRRMAFVSMTLLSVQMAQAQNVAVETGPFTADWESLSDWECPDWFRDAKFGIWAHWGPQCQAEDGDWYGRHIYFEGNDQYYWHLDHFGELKDFGLKDLCHAWKAEEWNPDELVKLYREVGARYFFTLGQHHDNFDLWNSPYQEWNSVNIGPKRDIVKGWADACKKYGLPLGVSMHGSHTWTWLEKAQDYDGNLTKEDGKGTWWEGYDPQELYAQRHAHSTGWNNSGTIHSQWDWGNGASLPDAAYKMKFQNRVLQCINDYEPDMIYFDDTVLPFYGCDESVGLNILQHYYNHSASMNGGEQRVVVMGKKLESMHKRAMLWDIERGIPDRIQEQHWQTCTCIGSWHYSQDTYERGLYKTAEQVVDMLVDVVSKNGNLLLSIPVKGNGSIDEKERAVLDGIKAWMDVNAKSIYGTRPWKTFGEGPLADASNPLNNQGFNEGNNYTNEDVRFAQRNDTVFATVMRWPSGTKFIFESFGISSPYYSGRVKSVELLGYGDVDFKNDIDGLVVTLPGEKPNAIAPVFAVTFEASAEGVSLMELIEAYEAKIAEMRATAGYNTGKPNRSSVNQFAKAVNTAREAVGKGDEAEQEAMDELVEAYKELKEHGLNEGGQPTGVDTARDVTVAVLKEADHFSRMAGGEYRFGTPEYWTVENFTVPQTNSDGTKNGLDRYTGQESLMLGVWNDKQYSMEGDLANARIYQKVTLAAGRYYFGAAYNANYQLSNHAYIFAADKTYATDDLADASIAYDYINKAGMDGNFYGIYFTLNEEQEVVLGFQVDLLNGSDTQEFRADHVKLLYYGEMSFDAIDQLILSVDAAIDEAVVNDNTGFYKQSAVDELRKALDVAMNLDENSSFEEIQEAYNALSAAYSDFQLNGKNAGGLPSETSAEDVTEELLVEASGFSRLDDGVTTRFATPKYWEVENFTIPQNNNDGTKNGLDRYPGYDCLMLGVWDDRQNNTDGDLTNARIYRKVSLKAGRYYFGASYQTKYNTNSQAYIFASSELLPTDAIPTQSIAYEPINQAEENEKFYGIYFVLPEAQEVYLGFQDNLLNGGGQQEFRARAVKLLYYGEISYATVTKLVEEMDAFVAQVIVNENTGFYSREAVEQINATLAAAKALSPSASFEEVSKTYNALTQEYAEFLANGKNPGGQPDTKKAVDITTENLVESGEFKRTADSGTARFGTPEYWTVENFRIPNGGDGTKNGLDKYPGYDCLMLGIWNDRENNEEGDLANARIYRKVKLDAGRYYFGCTFNTMHNLHKAYIFAAETLLATDEIDTKSIAYYNIMDCAADGKYWGIYFTLPEAQEIVLGFQADLANGGSTQEFRADHVLINSYSIATDIVRMDDAADERIDFSKPFDVYSVTGQKMATLPLHGTFILNQNGKTMKVRK